jgi:hypothetical protein
VTVEHPEPPAAVVERLRAICARLPDAREHEAWTGTSWRRGTSTFAHVVEITDGWPAAYAKAFDTDGPATVVTFQAAPDEYAALGAAGHPYHHPPWRPGIVGVVIDDSTDWIELAELVAASYDECDGRRARKE